MKKWFIGLGVLLFLLIAVLSIWVMHNLRDRHPDYSIDVKVINNKSKSKIFAGFGRKKITPVIVDTWNDANNDARYNENDGDTYNDKNQNGEFDAIWIAGFSNSKPAQGVHDDVWSRAIVIDDGNSRIALVSLDAIGFMHDDVIDIREMIPDELKIDYTLIASTHTHESNDLMGIWGESIFSSGVNAQAMEYVKTQTVEAIKAAVKNIRPAKLRISAYLAGEDAELIKDTRMPIVKASGISILRAVDEESDTTLGTLINWANHPESLWSSNLLISSDFPHYVRESIEKGIYNGSELAYKGLGGIAVYFTGAIGGLMAPHPSISVTDPFLDTVYSKPSFAKTKAIGEHVAIMAFKAMNDGETEIIESGISFRAKSFLLPLENTNFRIASAIGLLDRGSPELFNTRSEVAAIKIGPAIFLGIPGEIYPEIIYGGVEAPPGREFDIEPVEVPPIQNITEEQYKFYFGLSNDEIGYIIPKSEWDVEKPYLYNSKSDTYGEENSLGPDTGPIIYNELTAIIKEMK